MIAVQEFAGKAVGVFGLARSGLSAARALQAGGAKLFAWDDNEAARAGGGEGEDRARAARPLAVAADQDAGAEPRNSADPSRAASRRAAGEERRRRSDRRRGAVRARHPRRPREKRRRARHRGDGHKRKVDDDRADRSCPAIGGPGRASRRQYRKAGARPQRADREDDLRARIVVLSDRALAGPYARRGGAHQSLARSPRPPRFDGELRGRQGVAAQARGAGRSCRGRRRR